MVKNRVGDGLFEALSENLLVVEAAVNLVVDILYSRAVEVGGDLLLHLAGVDLYYGLLNLCAHERGGCCQQDG